jgi:glycosyltransferase involved in cell wall biosynthesis
VEINMRIIVFGTYQADSHPRIKVLIEGLRLTGHEVVEINEPLGISTAERVSMLQKPWTASTLPMKLHSRWWRLWRRGRAERRRRPPEVVLVGYMGHFDVHLARLVFRGSSIVLDHLVFAAGTAIDRGASTGRLTALLRLIDQRSLAAADVIVLDTAEHQAMVPADFSDRSVVAPVGADAAWFTAGEHAIADPADDEPVKVVFFGLYTPLQGAVVIGKALARLVDLGVEGDRISVTMIGAGQDLAKTKLAAGQDAPVTWLTWVPPSELPNVVALHHIALGIFGTTEKAFNVVPNKVYQAAAAGCAIVTSDTAPQRRLLEGVAELVPAGDEGALADVLAELIRDRSLLMQRRRQAQSLALNEFSSGAVVASLVAKLTSVSVPERHPANLSRQASPPLGRDRPPGASQEGAERVQRHYQPGGRVD